MKRALLIGIDAYDRQPSVIKPIRGCVNDVEAMAKALQSPAYAFDDVRVLRDAEATRQQILDALDALVAATQPDDVVVIHYAGHGSQKWNASGAEASGWDSTIVPFDSGRDPLDNRDITDDELRERLDALGARTPHTTLIFDSCHSGTITRGIEAPPPRVAGLHPRSAPPDDRGRTAVTTAGATRGVGKRVAGARGAGARGADDEAPRYVLFSGCLDEEESFPIPVPAEEGGDYHGALTYYLLQEIKQPGRRSHRDVHEALAPRVTVYSGQHPQLEGAADRELFGTTTLAPAMEYVLVTGRSINGVDLDAGAPVELTAGALHGVTVGSEYDIYRPGTLRPDEESRVGRVRVTRVFPAHAEAEPLGAGPAAIGIGARAVEAEHARGERPLRVALDPSLADATDATLPGAAAVRDALAASRQIALVPAAEPSDRRVLLLTPGASVPRLGAVTQPTLALVDVAGEPVVPLMPLGSAADFVANVEQHAALHGFLALENPASALAGAYTLEVLRQVPDAAAPGGSRWDVAAPDESGTIVFEDGDRAAFRVTSVHPEPLFATLVAVGVEGGRGALFPRDDEPPQRVGNQQPFTVLGKKGNGFRLHLPASEVHPFVPGAAPQGVDTITLLVTGRPARVAPLPDYRAAARTTRSAEPAAARSIPGSRTTSDDDDDAPAAAAATTSPDEWTVVRVRYVVRPKGSAPAARQQTLATPGATPGAVPAALANALGASAAGRVAVAAALGDAGMRTQQRFAIAPDAPSQEGGRAVPTARTVTVAPPPPDTGQLLVTTAANGVISWQLGETRTVRAAQTDGRGAEQPEQAVRVYTIPASAPAPLGTSADAQARSILSAAASKVAEVIVFPLVEGAMRLTSPHFAEWWEREHRPYRLRTFTADDYASPDGSPVDAAKLTTGRALLMVHGTFSRAHSAFGALPKAVVQRLEAHYPGGVIAFDHYSLAHDPARNVEELLAMLPTRPDGAPLDLDVVCHSRGGLVSRVLAERHADRVRVGKVVFVASPNAGTVLVEPEHATKLLDTFSNILSVAPPNGVTDVLEGVLLLAKLLAAVGGGATSGLPGLQAMRKDGDFLTRTLNAAGGSAAGDTAYFAMSSNFDPRPDTPALNAMLHNWAADRLFGAENDLVVPTDGVFAANGSARFPIAATRVFRGTDAVTHTEFFAQPAAHEQLLTWLGA